MLDGVAILSFRRSLISYVTHKRPKGLSTGCLLVSRKYLLVCSDKWPCRTRIGVQHKPPIPLIYDRCFIEHSDRSNITSWVQYFPPVHGILMWVKIFYGVKIHFAIFGRASLLGKEICLPQLQKSPPPLDPDHSFGIYLSKFTTSKYLLFLKNKPQSKRDREHMHSVWERARKRGGISTTLTH